jgi:hypothetical protein
MGKTKLLDQVHSTLQTRGYIPITEDPYIQLIKIFILFHGVCHPAEMGDPEINVFLTPLAAEE